MVKLNRIQIYKLNSIVEHFNEIETFTIKVDTTSGIGAGLVVSFDLFEPNDTKIDITDTKAW